MQTSAPSIHHTPKRSYTNKKCVKKGLTTHYTDWCWIKNPKQRAKYAFGRMRPQGSQKNLHGTSITQKTNTMKTEQTPEVDSWQLRILILCSQKQNYWLMDSIVDVHVCNDLRLMTNFVERPTRVKGSTLDGILSGWRTVRIRLALEDGTEGVILNLQNIYYLPNSPLNLISLSLLNNAGVYYGNKQQALYNKASQRPLAFT